MKRICTISCHCFGETAAVTIYIPQRNIVTITSLFSPHFRCCFLSAFHHFLRFASVVCCSGSFCIDNTLSIPATTLCRWQVGGIVLLWKATLSINRKLSAFHTLFNFGFAAVPDGFIQSCEANPLHHHNFPWQLGCQYE